MKVLVIGKGGREHALLWRLNQSETARTHFSPRQQCRSLLGGQCDGFAARWTGAAQTLFLNAKRDLSTGRPL